MKYLVTNFRRYALPALCLAGLGALSTAALAHHSFAMFDPSKEMKVTGTVSKFRFSNPHVYLVLSVAGKPGAAPKSYLLEGPTPVILTRLGWKRDTVKPGEKITVLYHPLKDGKPGGNALKVTLASGKVMSMETEDIKYGKK